MKTATLFTMPLLAASVCSLIPVNTFAKGRAPDLFDDFGISQSAKKTLPKKAVKGRNRSVNVNVDLLDEDRLTLNLFDDVVVTAVRDKIVDDNKDKSWIGHVEGEPDSEVFLTMHGKIMSGNVQIGSKTYEIEFKGNNKHDISQVDSDKGPKHSHSKTIDDFIAAGGQLDTTPTMTSAVTSEATAGTVIDLMVLYTPKVKANAAGQVGIETKIANAVTMANQSYINSRIDMQLNVVHVAEVNYTETGDMFNALSKMAVTNDGVIDQIHSWRDQYGADQVVIVTADTSACGIAYVMQSPSSAYSTLAFSAVHDDSTYACLSNNTLAHELGHNQGSQHNREDANTAGAYDYSYGYRLCQTGGFRTVMSYSCSGGTRVSYFSNPNVTLSTGQVTGTTTENNALSINNTKAIVAAFRPAAVNTAVPNAPGSLAATAVSDSAITLAWADNSANETGFRVERSLDGANWTEIAVTGSNAVTFNNTGLLAATAYFYRVRAFNSNGFSSYSNTGSAQTSPAACTTNAPALTLAPASLYSKTGASVNFSVSLANQDTSGCGSANFTLTNSDGGTIGTYLLSPAGSISANWTLTAPMVDGTYTKLVVASAAAHSNATASATIIVDGTAPSVPGNLAATKTGRRSVQLSWSAATDLGSGMANYAILRNGTQIATTTSTSFTDKSTLRGTTTYTVKAIDKAGNSSSSQKSITM